MELVIDVRGQVRCIYSEQIDLAALGKLSIKRASYVEPDGRGGWTADLSSTGGPRFGPFARRSEAINAEQDWLIKNWLSNEGVVI